MLLCVLAAFVQIQLTANVYPGKISKDDPVFGPYHMGNAGEARFSLACSGGCYRQESEPVDVRALCPHHSISITLPFRKDG